jgi:hypothetical protein
MKIHRLLDPIISIIFAIFIIVSGDNIAYTLGGTVVFLPLLAFIFFVSYVYKKFQMELSICSVIIITLNFINYLDYLEKNYEIPFDYVLVSFFLLFGIIIACFSYLGTRALVNKINLKHKNILKETKKRLNQRLTFFPILGIVFYIISAFPFLEKNDQIFIEKNIITYANLATLCLVLFFGITFLFVKKLDKYFVHLVEKDNQLESRSYRKYLAIGIGIIFLLGSMVELARGAWSMWIGTFVLLLFLFASIGSIWKSIPIKTNYHDLEGADLIIPELFDFKTILIFILTYSLGGTLYLMTLISFIHM